MLALDAVRECKETTVTLVTIVGDDAWGQSCFSHVALHLVGNRFGIGTIQHGELADELKSLGEEIGVQIKAQKEEIFQMMHRI